MDKNKRDWSTATLTELTDHIEEHYHEGLRRDIPRFQEEIELALADADPATRERLTAMKAAFDRMRDGLEDHLVFEEDVLFPHIHQLELVERGSRTEMAKEAMQELRHQHAQAEEARFRLQVLAEGAALPAGAAGVQRRLATLAAEMLEHMRLENEILFPRMTALEGKLKSQG